MTTAVALLAAALTWTAAAFKISAAWYQRGRMAPLSLVLTLLALGAGWLFLAPGVDARVDALAGSAVASHAVADALALATGAGTLSMVVFLTHDEATGRRLMRPRLLALVGAVAAMVTVAALHRQPVVPGAFVESYVPSLYFVAYSLPYLAFLGYVFWSITRRCWHYAASTPHVPYLPTGLRMISAGGAVGLTYVGARVAYLAAARLDPAPRLAHLHEVTSSLLLVAMTTLVTVGAVLPSAARRLGAYRDLRSLYPLWAALLRVLPDVGRAQGDHGVPSAGIDALPSRHLRFRRTRRVVEIRDAEYALRHRVPEQARQDVRDLAAGVHLPEGERAAVVEAGQLAIALEESAVSKTPASTTHTALPQAAGLDTEVTWLRRVARAFRRSPVVASAVARERARRAAPSSPPSRGDRLATLVSEVAGPGPVLAGLLITVGAASARHPWAGAGWGLVGAVFFSVLPLTAVAIAVRRGHLSDHHVSQRSQRPVVVSLSLLSFAAGFGVLAWGGAPRELLAALAALVGAALVCLVISLRWKISIHLGVAGCALSLLTLTLGPWMLLALVALAGVAWARVHLRAHTPAQVAAGSAVGVAVSALVFAAAR